MARWEDSELTVGDGLRSAARHVRNAIRRSWLVLLPGLLLAPLVFLVLTRRQPAHEATARFRVLQGWEHTNERNMGGFFKDTVLTSEIMAPVIVENGLYASQRKRAMYLAVQELREDLEVDAVRWELPGEPGLARRSFAVVTLGFTHGKHDVAEKVVRDLAERILDASTAASKARYVAASRGAAIIRATEAKTKRSPIFKERAETQNEREEQERKTKDAIAARMQKVIGAELEQEEQALDFEMMDLEVKQVGGPMAPVLAATVATFLSIFVTIVFALLSNVGHDLAGGEDDIREAGLRPLGKITMPSRGRS
jgi:hypothetical protein